MNKKICALCILIGLSLGSMSAYAYNAGNFFIGANGGYAQLDAPNDAGQGLNSIENKYTPSWSVYFGQQWPVTAAKDVSVGYELKYNDYGRAEYNGVGDASGGALKFDEQSVDLLALVSKTWQNGFDVFAEAGVSYQIQKAELSEPMYINNVYQENAGSHTTNQFSPTVGLGVGYMPTQHLNVYVAANYTWGAGHDNWNYVKDQNDLNQKTFAVSSVRLGVSYLF